MANLKKFRAKEGLSQMALAERVDTATNYISEIEIGRKFPSVDMIDKIARALHIGAYQLFIEESAKNDEKEREAGDYMLDIPEKIRKELAARLRNEMNSNIESIFLLK